jgi:hypothetical protein
MWLARAPQRGRKNPAAENLATSPPPPLPPPTHIRRQETGTRNPFHFHFHRGFDFKDKDRGQDPVSPQAAGRPVSVLFCVLCPV